MTSDEARINEMTDSIQNKWTYIDKFWCGGKCDDPVVLPPAYTMVRLIVMNGNVTCSYKGYRAGDHWYEQGSNRQRFIYSLTIVAWQPIEAVK